MSLMSKLKKCGKFCVCVFQVRVDHRAVPDLRFSHGLEVHSYEKGYESSAILGSDSLGALTHNSSGRGGCGRLAPALPVTSAPRIRTQNLDHVAVLHHTPHSERMREAGRRSKAVDELEEEEEECREREREIKHSITIRH